MNTIIPVVTRLIIVTLIFNYIEKIYTEFVGYVVIIVQVLYISYTCTYRIVAFDMPTVDQLIR